MRFGGSAGEKGAAPPAIERTGGAKGVIVTPRAARGKRRRTAFTAWLAPPATYTFHTSSSIVWFKEIVMTRKYIDCREFPSEMNCTVAMSADSDSELLEAAVQHAVTVHKHADSPELRAQLKTLFHEGTPPAEAPRA
ncbi:putative small metal-binding protein [Paraburkholderia youngii]